MFGEPDVEKFKTRLTSAQFSLWRAYMRVEPDTGTKLDYLAASIANLLGGLITTLGGRGVTIDGRLFEWGKPPEVE